MSKAVLISIRPKWCELIASGKKTIEVRKTAPKIETPFKCYIYCTSNGRPLVYGDKPCADGWTEAYTQTYGYSRKEADKIWGVMNGKVIGEFVCAEIYRYARYGWLKEPARYMKSSPGGYPATEIHFSDLKLSPSELEDYGKGAPLFGWHISDLKIYDTPKKLGEFKRHDPTYDFSIFGEVSRTYSINRPPQSWCYVEELP